MARANDGDKLKKFMSENPDMNSKTIADIWAKKYNMSPELVRTRVRYYRGAMGDKMRKQSDKSSPELRRQFISVIPDSCAIDYTPYVLPPSCRRGLILADIHLPYHNKKAIEAALEYGDTQNIDFIVLNGDITDCYMLSRFDKDPDAVKFKVEVQMTIQFLEHLVERYPGVKIIFKEGNHEHRWVGYLRTAAAEAAGFACFRLNKLLGLGEGKLKNVSWVPDKTPIHAGYLTIFHGDEWGGGLVSPVNPARGAFLKTSGIVAVAHSHITSEHSKMAIRDKMVTCWSIGCLCDLHPMYRRINDWNHGFAGLELSGDDFHLVNKRIHKGKIL